MTESMITVGLHGQQQLKDELLVATSGNVSQPTLGATAEATIADAAGESTVRVVVRSEIASTRPDDVLALVCAYNDANSVRYLADRAWRVIDEAPHWQPRCLLVVHHDATSALEDSAASTFVGALRELEGRLERLRQFSGAYHLALSDDVATRADVPSLPQTLLSCVDVVKAPVHVIWDRRAGCLTLTGRRALRRAFWLLDQDCDGLLSDAEVLLWYNRMYERACDEDVATIKDHLREIDAAAGHAPDDNTSSADPDRSLPGRGPRCLEAGYVTVEGFFALCQAMLADGRAEPVWAMLWESRLLHDGQPFSPADLERVPVPDEAHSVQLSMNGCRFFSAIFARCRAIGDLWEFTPECPWAQYGGMPLPDEHMDASEFLMCWKAVATLDPVAVAEFAYHWGYTSDAALLFVVKPTRNFRRSERDWPTTLRVLVLGSPGCGKSALLRRLVSPSASGADDEPRTVSCVGKAHIIRVLSVPFNGDDVTLILEEIDEVEAHALVADATAMAVYDGALMCFSPADDVSMDYMYECIPDLAKHQTLPIVMALTKADLPFSEEPRSPPPDVFLAKHGLPWCPFTLSVNDDRASSLGIGNDIDALPATLVEALHCVEATRLPVVSTARKVRRVVVVAAVVGVVGMLVKRLLRGRQRNAGN